MVVSIFGGLAITLELLWQLLRQLDPHWGVLLTVPHVIVWVVFLILVPLRKVQGLVREPFVTISVGMGAANQLLTRTGTALLNQPNVRAQVISSAITVAGHHYVAILIALMRFVA